MKLAAKLLAVTIDIQIAATTDRRVTFVSGPAVLQRGQRFNPCAINAEVLHRQEGSPVGSGQGHAGSAARDFADLLPDFRTKVMLVESVFKAGDGREEAVSRGADHWVFEGGGRSCPVKEMCHRHGFSDASFYALRSKFGGMEVSDAKRLKAVEQENARLKKLLA